MAKQKWRGKMTRLSEILDRPIHIGEKNVRMLKSYRLPINSLLVKAFEIEPNLDIVVTELYEALRYVKSEKGGEDVKCVRDLKRFPMIDVLQRSEIDGEEKYNIHLYFAKKLNIHPGDLITYKITDVIRRVY